MKHIIRSIFTILLVSFASTLLAQTPQDVTVRDLNSYETTPTSWADIGAHPLTGELVKFTAIMVGNPRNSGFSGYTAATDNFSRIHAFAVDTSAHSMGWEGMYMRLVSQGLVQTIEQLRSGDVVDIEGRLTFFPDGAIQVAQFDPTSITFLGDVYDTPEFQKFESLLEPVTINIADVNEAVGDGTHTLRFDQYEKYANVYARVEDATIVASTEAPTGRPNYYISDDGVTAMGGNDISLRFRNDRTSSGYRTGYNWIRPSEGPFTPPDPGSVVNINGFLVGTSFNYAGIGNQGLKISPWDDGVIWVTVEGEAVRLTPEGYPNDFVVVGFPPEFANLTLTPSSPGPSDEAVVSLDITVADESDVISTVEIIYSAFGSPEVTASMTNTGGNTYSFTFPTFANNTAVSYRVVVTYTDNKVFTYSSQQTQFFVTDGVIDSIATLTRTANDTEGPSPFVGEGRLNLDITATVVADSTDGFVIVHQSNQPWSGIALRNTPDNRKLVRGDVIHITEAVVNRQFNGNFLDTLTYTVAAERNEDYDSLIPEISTSVFGTSTRGAEYLGMVVRFNNVTVTSINADAPRDDFGEWTFTSAGSTTTMRAHHNFNIGNVRVGSRFNSQFNRNVALGAEFESLTAAVYFSFSNPKIVPRGLADFETEGNITLPTRTFSLLTPANDATVVVDRPISAEWDATSVDFDGDDVVYLWVLDDVPGAEETAFADPLLVLRSNNDGTEGKIELDYSTVNGFLAGQGLEIDQSREFVWTVWVTDLKDTVQVSTYANATGFTPIQREITLTRANEVSIHDVSIPSSFALQQNYPNPFNPTTVINFSLPLNADVRLTVYDLLGRQVAVLVDETRSAGVHSITVDGSRFASGVYMYRLQAGDYVSTRKMTLIK
jgi:hypothetical protein